MSVWYTFLLDENFFLNQNLFYSLFHKIKMWLFHKGCSNHWHTMDNLGRSVTLYNVFTVSFNPISRKFYNVIKVLGGIHNFFFLLMLSWILSIYVILIWLFEKLKLKTIDRLLQWILVWSKSPTHSVLPQLMRHPPITLDRSAQ